MRGSFIILVLLPIFSCSHAKLYVQEYQPNSNEIEEEERVNLADVDTIGFFMGCLEEPATIDFQKWENYLPYNYQGN